MGETKCSMTLRFVNKNTPWKITQRQKVEKVCLVQNVRLICKQFCIGRCTLMTILLSLKSLLINLLTGAGFSLAKCQNWELLQIFTTQQPFNTRHDDFLKNTICKIENTAEVDIGPCFTLPVVNQRTFGSLFDGLQTGTFDWMNRFRMRPLTNKI